MPVVINEVEVLDAPAAVAHAAQGASGHAEPVYEQLRRYQRDTEARDRRRTAD